MRTISHGVGAYLASDGHFASSRRFRCVSLNSRRTTWGFSKRRIILYARYNAYANKMLRNKPVASEVHVWCDVTPTARAASGAHATHGVWGSHPATEVQVRHVVCARSCRQLRRVAAQARVCEFTTTDARRANGHVRDLAARRTPRQHTAELQVAKQGL